MTHNAEKTCWNCPAAKLKGNVDFRGCGQSGRIVPKGESKQIMIECKRRPELGHFEPTIEFQNCPKWKKTEYGYLLKDMRVMILGIDGYLGWTLALKLGNLGLDVSGIDNFTRRECVDEKGSESIVPIRSIDERLEAAKEVLDIDIDFREMDIREEEKLREFIEEVEPEAIVHYAEIPSAPYSMVDSDHAVEVQDNNVLGTLKLLHIIRDVVPTSNLIKLGCYDDETEILTEDGWKLFKNLEEDDKVATRSKDDKEVVFKEPNSIHEYDYEGEMYYQENTRLDFCVTPNHRIFTQKRSNTEYKELRLESVQDVEGERRVYDTGMRWNGENKEYFDLPTENGERKIPMKLWMKFLGWYLSEGSIRERKDRPNNYRVSIKQSKESSHLEELEQIFYDLSEILDKNFSKIEDEDCYKFSIGSKDLANYLERFGKARDKYVPKEIKKLDEELLERLLFSLISGDGWEHRPTDDRDNFRYYTISKELADDVQEVALKCGFSAIVTESKSKEGYQVSICQTPRVHVNHSEPTDGFKDYDGKVYCVNVGGDGIVLVRRNGKPVWSGNTMGEYGSPLTGRPLFEGLFPSDAKLEWENQEWSMGGELTPRDPASFYHCSKVHDSYNIYESCKYWWLRSMDVMQGIIYGVHTEELAKDERLRTRLDIDEAFGTAVNRFVSQAVDGVPLTVYGEGEQIRGMIPLRDAMECMVRLIGSPPEPGQYDVVNQISGVHKIKEVAETVAGVGNREFDLDVGIQRLENPRVEAEEHPMHAIARKLPNEYGFESNVSMKEEVEKMFELLAQDRVKERIKENREVILPETRWDNDDGELGVIEEYEPGEKEMGRYKGKIDRGKEQK